MKTFGSAVVLCGGKSSRMGFDKSRIRIDNQPIYEYVADQLAEVFEEVILVSGTSNPVTSLKYKTIKDEAPACGPMGGILTGLRQAASEFVFFTACDMPYVDLPLISRIQSALGTACEGDGSSGAVALNKGFIEPFYSFYGKAMIPDVEKSIETGCYQISRLVKQLPFLYLEESFWKREGAATIFSNLNYPEDLEPLREAFGERLSTTGQIVKEVTIEKRRGETHQTLVDPVVCEQLLHIYVNGRHYTSMSITPGDECELTAGFLLSQGLLSQLEELKAISFEPPDLVRVMIDQNRAEGMAERLALTSGCGSGKTRMSLFSREQIRPIASRATFEAASLTRAMAELVTGSQLFKETGGVHSCALYDQKGLVVVKEDIGRHNAADKAIGACFLKGRRLDDLCLLTTGRVSADILLKAVQAGIPVLASHSAPTDLAVEMAQWARLTLVGFVRGDRMNLYSDFGRII